MSSSLFVYLFMHVLIIILWLLSQFSSSIHVTEAEIGYSGSAHDFLDMAELFLLLFIYLCISVCVFVYPLVGLEPTIIMMKDVSAVKSVFVRCFSLFVSRLLKALKLKWADMSHYWSF